MFYNLIQQGNALDMTLGMGQAKAQARTSIEIF